MKINGDLQFHTLGSGEIKNGIMERLQGGAGGINLPTGYGTAERGYIVFNTDDSLYYFWDGSAWQQFGGGSNSSLQQEVDNIESASGNMFRASDGSWDAAPLSGANNITNPTDLANAILQLDSAITGTNELSELADTNISNSGAPTAISYLKWDTTAGKWVDDVLTVSDITDLTASATELNYTQGVTSSIQTQLDGLSTEDGYIRAFVGKTGAGSETPTYTSTNYVADGDTLEAAIGKLDSSLQSGLTSIYVDTLADVADGNHSNGSTTTTTGDLYALKGNAAGDGYDVDSVTLGDINNVASGVDTAANDDVLAFDGTQWTAITPATFAADINIGDLKDVTDTAPTYTAGTLYGLVGTAGTSYTVSAVDIGNLNNVTDNGTVGHILYADSSTTWASAAPGATSGVQPYDSGLTDIANLTPTNDNFIVGDGTNWTTETPSDARTSLGLVAGGAGDIWVEKAGDTMSGPLNMGSNNITTLADPVNAQDAATKAYVDSVAAGLDPKNACYVATTADLGFTYDDTGSGANDGVGDTLTAPANGATTIDGITLDTVGQRVLVKNQTTASQNGIYEVTTVGDSSNATVLTRATDFDGSPSNEVSEGAYTFVEQGSTQEHNGYLVTGTATSGDGNIVVGTDAIVWTQATGAGSINAGVGLSQSGNVINVNLGAGIVELPTDEVGIDLYDSANGAIILTTDGTTRGTATGAQLHLLLNGSTLTQDSTGLYVSNGGITETQLATSVAGDGLTGGAGTALAVNVDNSTLEIVTDTVQVKDGGITNAKLAYSTIGLADGSGTGSVALGGTITISAGEGIGVSVSGSTFTVSGEDASATNKGIATFNSADFDVTSGDVTIKAGGVSNTQLDNSIITMSDGTNTDDVALGETFTITGGTGITATVSANQVTIDRDSMATNDLSDVTAAASATGQVMVANSSNNYVPAQIQYVHTQGTAATSWTVSHSLGQRYVNVTVYDSNNQVIIPQSITATDSSTTTITFNTAITGVAVVMGVPGV